MYISFYLDDVFYSGTVARRDHKRSVWYEVDLGEKIRFVVRMGKHGNWKSDFVDIPKGLIRAAGAEIERHEDGFEPAPMRPRKYGKDGAQQ